MRISYWSSDVCSSDLLSRRDGVDTAVEARQDRSRVDAVFAAGAQSDGLHQRHRDRFGIDAGIHRDRQGAGRGAVLFARHRWAAVSLFGERSEEHTSELHSLMRISYAVFCLKKKKQKNIKYT